MFVEPELPPLALGRGVVAVAWLGIHPGPARRSRDRHRCGSGRQCPADASRWSAKARVVEKKCWETSCRDEGEQLQTYKDIVVSCNASSVHIGSTVHRTRAGLKNIKGSFPWTYCAHVLLINGNVFLLLVMLLRHGSNLRKMLFCSKIRVCILFLVSLNSLIDKEK